jgi:hypothetical protein
MALKEFCRSVTHTSISPFMKNESRMGVPGRGSIQAAAGGSLESHNNRPLGGKVLLWGFFLLKSLKAIG